MNCSDNEHGKALPECLDEFRHIRESLDRGQNVMRRIEKFLTGNGEPERGIIMRLDRLERTQADRMWLKRAFFTSLITVLAINAVAVGIMMLRLWAMHTK